MKLTTSCEYFVGIAGTALGLLALSRDIALNAQYHDYCELLKAWFGDNIDTKVIESAVNFWFKDDDYKGGNKVYKYFREA